MLEGLKTSSVTDEVAVFVMMLLRQGIDLGFPHRPAEFINWID